MVKESLQLAHSAVAGDVSTAVADAVVSFITWGLLTSAVEALDTCTDDIPVFSSSFLGFGTDEIVICSCLALL